MTDARLLFAFWPLVRLWALATAMWSGLPAMALAGTVTVFAAASTKTALDEIAAEFGARTGHRVVLSFAGSSSLARQIQFGAPADVFLSASPDWMDVLVHDGLIEPDTRTDLLSNSLVLIAHAPDTAPVDLDAGTDLAALLSGGRMAMALVDAVPAGVYGKAALTSLGLWQDVSGRIAQADNVRAALALVALGEAPLGIVYATDAAAEPRVGVIARFPEHSHPPIRYPVAAIAGRLTAETQAFLDFLGGADARAAFRRQGFVPLD